MLQGSVGQNGRNAPDDVRLVQTLLNARRAGGFALAVNGLCAVSMIAAIRRFQSRTMGEGAPDGRVDPNGPTLRALLPVATRAPVAVPCEPIPQPIVSAAQAAEQSCGVPACISIAQWILESDRGIRMPDGSNNPFGIKAAFGEPYVTATTREVYGGRTVTINARFRKFASIADAFAEHGQLLATFPAYRPAMQAARDPDLFADRLTGVYATDPNYGTALKAIMRGSNLYRYNLNREKGSALF